MSQFFGQQQLAAQYFRPQYIHGAGGTPPVQDGRSGYWRMFYYQLQEEELKRHEQKQGQEATEGKSEVPQAKPVAAAKPKRAPPERRAAPVVELPKVHPRPIYQKQPEPFDVAPWLATINAEFRAWNLSAQTLHGLLQQRKAANDEEEEVLTLLLLAA